MRRATTATRRRATGVRLTAPTWRRASPVRQPAVRAAPPSIPAATPGRTRGRVRRRQHGVGRRLLRQLQGRAGLRLCRGGTSLPADPLLRGWHRDLHAGRELRRRRYDFRRRLLVDLPHRAELGLHRGALGLHLRREMRGQAGDRTRSLRRRQHHLRRRLLGDLPARVGLRLSHRRAPSASRSAATAIVRGREQCDDGNTAAGDGCSPTCQTEPGYRLLRGRARAGRRVRQRCDGRRGVRRRQQSTLRWLLPRCAHEPSCGPPPGGRLPVRLRRRHPAGATARPATTATRREATAALDLPAGAGLQLRSRRQSAAAPHHPDRRSAISSVVQHRDTPPCDHPDFGH